MKIIVYIISLSLSVPLHASPMFLDLEYTSNVVHLGARHLSLITGRFLNQDPKKQYLSHYNYGKGDIMTVPDPTGYGEESLVRAIVEDTQEKSVTPLKEDIQSVKTKDVSAKSSEENAVITPKSPIDTDNSMPTHKESFREKVKKKFKSFKRTKKVLIAVGVTLTVGGIAAGVITLWPAPKEDPQPPEPKPPKPPKPPWG